MKIHTLNARGNILLEVIRDQFKLSPPLMLKQIQCMLAETTATLNGKGIRYDDLKTALVPDVKKQEIALVFNILDIEAAWYGYCIHEKLIPLFHKKSTHSILVGDCIAKEHLQDRIKYAFNNEIIAAKSFSYAHSEQFYVVYINNLSDNMVSTFHSKLSQFSPYAGYFNLTYSSFIKTYLSTVLANCYIKHRNIILMQHEDDRENQEDINMLGYPFTQYDYDYHSLQSTFFGTLLSYKIERIVFKDFEVDTEFSLNAVSDKPGSLPEFSIQIDIKKFDYLLEKKGHSLQRLGIPNDATGLEKLKHLITTKISSNYIYNMSHDSQHNTMKFNIMLEGISETKSRHLVALEYQPEEKVLRLITLI